jgi:3-dehydroquinate synthase
MNRSIRVNLGARSYDVQIAPGMMGQLSQLTLLPRARSAVVIADRVVAGLYGQQVLGVLKSAGLRGHLIEFPNGEANKTLATYSKIFDELFALRPAVDRDTIIVALGGGVSGDLAGFVAATALRGLRWVQVPTTLLADVDASVGGKTGVDTAAGKNLIGAFHQPICVFVDVLALRTLSDDDIRTGLAECVKHGAIRQVALLEFLESPANQSAIFARDADVLADLVGQNVAIKAQVIAADETEAGLRAHLNFGHTIGHAIETLLGYGRISHGQGISLGMIAACQLSLSRGLVEQSYASRLEKLLDQLGLQVRWAGLDGDEIIRIMQHDKKNRDGKIRMVLPVGPGRVDVFTDISADAIRATLRYLAG